jgi:biopolymer transport protein TolR
MAIKADAGAAEAAGRVRGSLAEINVIPLVDVVLVLLLIFMLTAPMMYRGIDVNLPRSGGPSPSLTERLVLTITKDRVLYLNNNVMPLATLETRMRELMKDRPDKTLFIKADKDLVYGHVIETMDRVRRAGVERVGMVTEPTVKKE